MQAFTLPMLDFVGIFYLLAHSGEILKDEGRKDL